MSDQINQILGKSVTIHINPRLPADKQRENLALLTQLAKLNEGTVPAETLTTTSVQDTSPEPSTAQANTAKAAKKITPATKQTAVKPQANLMAKANTAAGDLPQQSTEGHFTQAAEKNPPADPKRTSVSLGKSRLPLPTTPASTQQPAPKAGPARSKRALITATSATENKPPSQSSAKRIANIPPGLFDVTIYKEEIAESPFDHALEGPYSILNRRHFVFFVVQKAEDILRRENYDVRQLSLDMAAFFSDTIVVNKHHSEDINSAGEIEQLSANKSLVILLAVGKGEALIESIDDKVLPLFITQKLNRATRASIPFDGLRRRFYWSLPENPSREQFYLLLANLVSVFMPSYIVVTRRPNGNIAYRARVIEELSLHNTELNKDSIRQTSVHWSLDPFSQETVRLFAIRDRSAYNRPQVRWNYELLDQRRTQEAENRLAEHVTVFIQPPTTLGLNKVI